MWLEIRTYSEAIDALGGTTRVGRLFEPPEDPRTVANWRRRGLPADTWLVLGPLLKRRGVFSPAKLFGMREPRRAGDGVRTRDQG